jgi:ABC-type Fe3+ transport system permease subunit
MKKYLAAMAMVVVFLAVFIPFASSSPDGLQKVATSMRIEEPAPAWHGLMGDYSISALGNGYVSTLAAGVLGTLMVLGISLVLGAAISRRNQPNKENGVVSSGKKD